MMGTLCKASAALLGALLLSGCNQSSGSSSASAAPRNDCVFVRCNQVSEEPNAAPTQAFASTQTPEEVVKHLAQAVSGPWNLVTDQDGTTIYVSVSSYHLLNNGKVAIVEKLTGKASAPDPATADIVEYDCANHTQTMVATFGLDASVTKVIGSHSKLYHTSDAPVTTLSPGMVAWTALEPFCKVLGTG